MSSPTRHAMTHEEFAEAALDAMKEEKALGSQVYPSPPESFCVKLVPPLCLKCQVWLDGMVLRGESGALRGLGHTWTHGESNCVMVSR